MLAWTVVLLSLPPTRLYLVSFFAYFSHIARYTPSTTHKIASDKFRLFSKANL